MLLQRGLEVLHALARLQLEVSADDLTGIGRDGTDGRDVDHAAGVDRAALADLGRGRDTYVLPRGAGGGNAAAKSVLDLREDPNRVLTTILWGNVGINVLLALLSNSVMAGVQAFLFSTIVITFLGEIIPQASGVRL